MKRKIHITEEQLNKIVKKINEAQQTCSFTPNNFEDGTPVADAVEYAKSADKANPNATTLFNGQKVDSTTNTSEFVNSLKDQSKQMNGGNIGIKESFTKKQIKEARLNKLVKNSVRLIKKKNLK